MPDHDDLTDDKLAARFPRSSKYNPAWIAENGFGGHPLWQTEWLCEALPLEPGMRVLDLGCGRVKSSIFLAKEYDVEVWATDLWVTASENWQRIKAAGLENKVFPLHADARLLPFAGEFFDAILAVDCYSYYGTDDLYLNYLANFVKPGGFIGIAGAGLVKEMTLPVPEHLKDFWSQDLWALHSANWWRHLWERTGIVEITNCDTMPDGWKIWSLWHHRSWPDNTDEIKAIEVDAGEHLSYIRLVGKRMPGVELAEYTWPDGMRSFPYAYEHQPLFKTEATN